MSAKTPPGGATIAVRIQPKSRRPGLLGIVLGVDGKERLRIAVAEPPTEGRATEAVRGMLAQLLDIPATNVKLVAGRASRDKLFLVAGDRAELASRLARMQLRLAESQGVAAAFPIYVSERVACPLVGRPLSNIQYRIQRDHSRGVDLRRLRRQPTV